MHATLLIYNPILQIMFFIKIELTRTCSFKSNIKAETRAYNCNVIYKSRTPKKAYKAIIVNKVNDIKFYISSEYIIYKY